eukprot:CAMPEP_0202387984 /NCGR_PEP_ID=MMETSP1127-20130417/75073_1 /ASSEMBLY_ACC=CAM_ASM_000462 /TAXON_ID=3047 /ORGANISM="Dunaliella tertiolecta, Strain CCMP1320" /LENGTH=99 /DNA_ID=CAMNT_0048989229 /DNA_START=218 /DNA_END=518 /DNA_ORIENTATION=+
MSKAFPESCSLLSVQDVKHVMQQVRIRQHTKAQQSRSQSCIRLMHALHHLAQLVAGEVRIRKQHLQQLMRHSSQAARTCVSVLKVDECGAEAGRNEDTN